MHLTLIGGRIITPFREIKNGGVIIRDDQIYAVGNSEDLRIPDNSELIDVSGSMICPGFVDLLVHGGGGFGFSDGSDESIAGIGDYFMRHGSTTMLASLHAKPEEDMLNDLKRVAGFIRNNPASNIKGIHMEGPYLNTQLKGAMNENYLMRPTIESFRKINQAAGGFLKMMTIAPELPGALDVIREASFNSVVCSIGHSMADYEQIDAAIDNGAAHVTHMFNAMKPMHHRTPSVITGALLRDELKIELIADTFHVHPAVMELLLKVKTPKGIILITDSIRAGGLHSGETQFSDQKVIVSKNTAKLEDGTLAGSTLTLNQAVKNIVETTGARITDAVRMATLNPSKVIGAGRGILASGKQADLVVLDRNYEVQYTILAGKIRYKRELN